MGLTTFSLSTDDGTAVHTYRWACNATKAVVQIAHGMGEHAGRYARVAERLNDAGYAVYANDLRGHGRTAASIDDLGVLGEKDGWNRLVGDLSRLGARIRDENPGLPVFLLGHSMGSAAVQHLLIDDAESLAGAVLSGSTSFDSMAGAIDAVRQEAGRLGHRGPSELLTFAAFNAAFAPARTEFDWLSRDPEEVDAYVADPLCGFTISAQGWLELLEAGVRFSDPENLRGIPERLPIYLFSGELDPVHAQLDGLHKLIGRYREAGVRDLTCKFYPGGRHEMFNETNRDEVTDDLIVWLDAVLGV